MTTSRGAQSEHGPSSSDAVDVTAIMEPLREHTEVSLRRFIDEIADLDGARPPARLVAAMAHPLLSGGKRLRPVITLVVAEAVAGPDDDPRALATPAAVALELVHTYSLVHDDLPALDDDDLRRGRPTVHRAFDEATAVLVGDALVTDAFLVLAGAERLPALQVRELAAAAGSAGMVAGQHDDIAAEGRTASAISLEELQGIHRRKTGRLFAAAAALGVLAVGRHDLVDDARRFGAALGFAFQVQDDVLDVEGDVEKGGKVRGRDLKHDKLTTVRVLGLEGAKVLARQAADDAVVAAGRLQARAGSADHRLAALARFAATRTH
jgi:geranylgeranyl diphosphate synthase type II